MVVEVEGRGGAEGGGRSGGVEVDGGEDDVCRAGLGLGEEGEEGDGSVGGGVVRLVVDD